jgi:hypothetical protein
MKKNRTMKDILPVGTKVLFHSGNFIGLDGIVQNVSENVPNTPFGFLIRVLLSNGKIGYLEKSEHFTKVRG